MGYNGHTNWEGYLCEGEAGCGDCAAIAQQEEEDRLRREKEKRLEEKKREEEYRKQMEEEEKRKKFCKSHPVLCFIDRAVIFLFWFNVFGIISLIIANFL